MTTQHTDCAAEDNGSRHCECEKREAEKEGEQMIWVIEYREKQPNGEWGEPHSYDVLFDDEIRASSYLDSLRDSANRHYLDIQYSLVPYIRLNCEEPANDMDELLKRIY